MSQEETYSTQYAAISPKYMMGLIARVEKKLFDDFGDNSDIDYYLQKWVEQWDYWNNNFDIARNIDGDVDVRRTLHGMPPDVLIKIAIDLGIETPGMLPSIPMFQNTLKDQNPNAQENFERAIKNVGSHPDDAVALANSTFESVLKTIVADGGLDLTSEAISRDVGKALSNKVIPALGFASGKEAPKAVNRLASSLLGMASAVSDLRNDKSSAHGSAPDDYVIDDPLWAELVVNATAAVGLFLWEFYSKTKLIAEPTQEALDFGDIPF